MSGFSKTFLIIASLCLAGAVLLDAYGVHGLQAHLDPADWEAWKWAVQMQFLHSLGLGLVAVLVLLMPRSWLLRWAAGFMILGMILFCGGIYAQTFGAPAFVGHIVPYGGTSFTVAWLLVAAGVARARIAT